MFILLAILSASPAFAGDCSDGSNLRLESATALLDGLSEVRDAAKAAQVERARILLEHTIEDDPSCDAAVTLKSRADTIFEQVEAISSDAAAEDIYQRALAAVIDFESSDSRDPAEVEATMFLLFALADRLPGDQRVADLSTRIGLLGGVQ